MANFFLVKHVVADGSARILAQSAGVYSWATDFTTGFAFTNVELAREMLEKHRPDTDPVGMVPGSALSAYSVAHGGTA